MFALPLSSSRSRNHGKAVLLACAILGFGLMGFTSEVNQARGTPKAAPLKPVLHIIAFGSSSTEGVGASNPSAAYPAQLQRVLSQALPKGMSAEVVNSGIGGQDVDDMLARLQADVLARKPDIVIWQTGSNDPLRQVPIERFEAKTREGIEAMQQRRIAVILMEPQWCPLLQSTPSADRFREAVRRIGGDLGVPVIRRFDLMQEWIADGRLTRTQMLAPDGLHMSDGGYAQLAADVATVVLKAGVVMTTMAALQVR